MNRRVLLKSRPVGVPQKEHFEIVETPVPTAREGEFVVRNAFLAVEPAMRGWVNAVGNYSEPVGIGEVMRSFAAGEIVESRHPDYSVGEQVMGMFGWQDHAVSDGRSVVRRVARDPDLPLSTSLGVLGLNGITAYFGLLEVAPPKSGEAVVVSTAAGAVGSCVGQIAKIMGCRAVGIAGGQPKVALCRDVFGFDAAIDYKADGDLGRALKDACPAGIDVYFDNTSGPISDAVLGQLNVGARVAICGTASVASWDPVPLGPRVERHLLVKRARMQGFLVLDYSRRYGEAIDQLSRWVKDGRIAYREEYLDGIEAAPDAIAGLYRGENLGRRLIRLS
jgi:NADPH-dependent curcumin reductase